MNGKRAPYTKPSAEITRRPYVKPTVVKLTPEQARLKLLGIASMGEDEAEEVKELLERMFPAPPRNHGDRKKSA